ncbi:MAG: peptidoglycan DD-metalloendopeptidase family protein [Candidatus Pacebacteria bacterium]|nr:peptidoglycan DD-metalloendopeptidase family protein [Candidatus Paceibacterota bacterium]
MIFPKLKNKKFGYLNLDLEGKKWVKENTSTFKDFEKNPLIEPAVCLKMVEEMHRKFDLDFSYGGWLEDRSFLWKDSYLEDEGLFIHLGIDISVDPGTEVAIDFDAQVVLVDDDYPEIGGWGPRVIVKNLEKGFYVIYAHLDRKILCKVGERLPKGSVFARAGKAPYNGNWWPHIHVQVIEASFYESLSKTGLMELDGYGNSLELENFVKAFRDPLCCIRLAD